jgi:hypothetical protein
MWALRIRELHRHDQTPGRLVARCRGDCRSILNAATVLALVANAIEGEGWFTEALVVTPGA